MFSSWAVLSSANDIEDFFDSKVEDVVDTGACFVFSFLQRKWSAGTTFKDLEEPLSSVFRSLVDVPVKFDNVERGGVDLSHIRL